MRVYTEALNGQCDVCAIGYLNALFERFGVKRMYNHCLCVAVVNQNKPNGLQYFLSYKL